MLKRAKRTCERGQGTGSGGRGGPPSPVIAEESPGYQGDHGYHLLKAKDELILFVEWWRPKGDVRAVILLLHGSGLRSANYAALSEAFVSRHYAVYAMDLRGFGQSQDNGIRVAVNSVADHLDDLEQAVHFINQREPGLQRFVLGESYGSAMAVLSVLENKLPVEGMVLCGPAYKPSPRILGLRLPYPAIWVPIHLIKWWGAFFPSTPVGCVPLGFLEKRAMLYFVLQDETTVQAIIDDPFTHTGTIPAGYVTAVTEAIDRIQPRIEEFEMPFLILHGSDDRIVSPAYSREFVERAGAEDKSIKIYDGSPHAVLFDTNKESAYEDIFEWLDERAMEIRHQAT